MCGAQDGQAASFWEFSRDGVKGGRGDWRHVERHLCRTIQILDIDILTEEERVRVFDVCDRAYPILARTLAARRDNLKVTVAALEQRLQMIVATTPRITAEAA